MTMTRTNVPARVEFEKAEPRVVWWLGAEYTVIDTPTLRVVGAMHDSGVDWWTFVARDRSGKSWEFEVMSSMRGWEVISVNDWAQLA
jgi:hypothetical protein